MKRYIVFPVFLLVFALTIPAIAADATSCETCHGKLKGRLHTPVEQWRQSVHHEYGITCNRCHGGNPDATAMKDAHSRAAGWIGKPSAIQIVEKCGTCHANEEFMKQYNPNARTDQLKNYRTSFHGKNILEKKAGDGATCASCHGAHDVLKASDPRSHVYATKVVDTCATCHENSELMNRYGIEGNEVADYRASVHYQALTGKNDLFAPTCNDCHGNHGAVPPGVGSIVNVCGTCHAMNQKLFAESPHAAWEDMGFKMCMECHGNHAIQSPSEAMLSRTDGVCLNCHGEDEDAFATMTAMHDAITGLKAGMDETGAALDQVAEKGVFVEDARLELQDAHNSYIKARTAVHKFDAAHVTEVLKAGVTAVDNVRTFAETAAREVRKRRTGLYLFLGLLAVIVILIGLKLKFMESDN